MKGKDRPIGVFDSGIGGLTVLEQLKKYLPNEKYIYVGDIKNSPYGEKSKEQIIEFTRNIINYFVKQNVKMVIVACNTASSFIEEIRREYDLPILTVMDAAIDAITNQKNILLAATKSAIDAGIYVEKIKNANQKADIYTVACRDIVPSIENKDLNDIEKQEIVDKYIKQYKDRNIEFLILGCTHYPIWKKYFRNSIGEDTYLFDPSENLAKNTYNYLSQKDLLNSENGEIEFIVTDKKDKFEKNIKKLFNNIEMSKISQKEI